MHVLSLLVLFLVSALPAMGADGCREDSLCDVDLTFTTTANAPALCPTFDYVVHDKNSGRLLLAKTTESAPASKPCPKVCASGTKLGQYCSVDGDCPPGTAGSCATQAGCTTVRLPASANPYVGRCANAPQRSCTQNSQCAPATCDRAAGEITQPHVLSGVCEPGTANQYTFWVELPLLNGQFIPLP